MQAATLDEQPRAHGAADLHLKASINRALGQSAEAITASQASLDREPLQVVWRYELAELWSEQDRFQESFQELLKIQMLQPQNDQARALLNAVKGKIAEGR